MVSPLANAWTRREPEHTYRKGFSLVSKSMFLTNLENVVEKLFQKLQLAKFS